MQTMVVQDHCRKHQSQSALCQSSMQNVVITELAVGPLSLQCTPCAGFTWPNADSTMCASMHSQHGIPSFRAVTSPLQRPKLSCMMTASQSLQGVSCKGCDHCNELSGHRRDRRLTLRSLCRPSVLAATSGMAPCLRNHSTYLHMPIALAARLAEAALRHACLQQLCWGGRPRQSKGISC